MQKLALLLVTAVVCSASIRVKGEEIYESGNAFLSQCSVVEKPIRELPATATEGLVFVQCIAYVRGLRDGIIIERAVLSVDKVTFPEQFCYHEEVEDAQLARILLKYIRTNPEKAHLITGKLFLDAMREAFPPCQKK